MESMPVDDATVDVIISNCVINLSPDKDAVFRESLPRAEAGRPLPRRRTSCSRASCRTRRRTTCRCGRAARRARCSRRTTWRGCRRRASPNVARRQPQQDRREALVQRDDLGVQAGGLLLGRRRMAKKPTILFACVHNAGRSQIAAGLAVAHRRRPRRRALGRLRSGRCRARERRRSRWRKSASTSRASDRSS